MQMRQQKRVECPARHKAPVAQLDRVLGFEPSGREFESLRARQEQKGVPTGPLFVLGVSGCRRRVQFDKSHAIWTPQAPRRGEDRPKAI